MKISIEYNKVDNLLSIDSSQGYASYDANLSLQEVRDLIDDLVNYQQLMEARQEEIKINDVDGRVLAALEKMRLSEQTLEEVKAELIALKQCQSINIIEADLIERTMVMHDWNIKEAAKELKTNPITLYRKMKEYRIEEPKK